MDCFLEYARKVLKNYKNASIGLAAVRFISNTAGCCAIIRAEEGDPRKAC
jgi:hypothetical protein